MWEGRGVGVGDDIPVKASQGHFWVCAGPQERPPPHPPSPSIRAPSPPPPPPPHLPTQERRFVVAGATSDDTSLLCLFYSVSSHCSTPPAARVPRLSVFCSPCPCCPLSPHCFRTQRAFQDWCWSPRELGRSSERRRCCYVWLTAQHSSSVSLELGQLTVSASERCKDCFMKIC